MECVLLRRGRLYSFVGYPGPELSGKVREQNELRARKGPTHRRGKIESSLTRRSGCASAGIARSERDGTCAETRFGLSAKWTSPFKLVEGQFSRLLATEGRTSVVVMVVMLDAPCSEVECKTTGYPLHSHVPPSLSLTCITMCHQVSTELYHTHINPPTILC